MNKKMDLIPYPHELKLRKGFFNMGVRAAKIFLSGVTEADSARLLGAAERLGAVTRVAGASDADIVLEVSSDLEFPASVRADVLDQGYALDISATAVRARSRSACGLFYALQTLLQLGREKKYPCCAIRDWPDLPFRALHIVGGGNFPKFEEILKLIDRLAAWKYNALVLEYDDRFSFDRYPVLNHPAALRKDQIRNMLAFSAERFFDVIPSLDSLGHAQFYLMHKEFQHLAELPGKTHEFCASNPETLRFIKELWTEVLDVHQGAKFASITGDEVFRLGGFCPQCSKFAKAGKLSELYTNYYSDLGNWIVKQGARPIMWDDMILMHPEAIGRLPRETVFANWNYSGHPTGAQGLSLFVRGAGEFRPGEEAKIPEPYARLFSKYFKATDGKTPFEPFPFLRFFKANGFDALAAPMANTMEACGFLGRVSNNRFFCISACKAGSLGLLNTTWESYLPTQNSLHGIAAGGAYSWNAGDEPESLFMERFARMMIGRASGLPKAAAVMDRLFVDARGFDTAVRVDDLAVIDETARDLRADAKTAPDEMGTIYAELSALRMEKSLRMAALQELAVLLARIQVGGGDDQPLDISSYLNWNGVMPKRSGIFDPAPGRQIIHGIPFEIADPSDHDGRCGICVGGQKSLVGADYGQAIKMPLARKCDALFFLVAGAWGAVGARDGLFRMRFADGAHADLPLVVGRNLWDWSGGMRAGSRNFLTDGLLAWEGGKVMDGGHGYRFGMYLCWWMNPRPDFLIEQVEILPQDEETGFVMLFGLTARMAGTTRPPADLISLRQRAAVLLKRMEQMENENGQMLERHRELYARLEAPEDVERQMERLTSLDLKDGIEALKDFF